MSLHGNITINRRADHKATIKAKMLASYNGSMKKFYGKHCQIRKKYVIIKNFIDSWCAMIDEPKENADPWTI